ncbi:MAG TPA: dihydrofolate reductase family protein [Anaerolineales bacterium]|nr:dihydrofolate reductase family protein [Anaerolineales bacterium]
MGKVTTGFSMSLDGFVAGPNDGPENSLGDGGDRLFEWYFSGDATHEVPSGNGVFKMSEEGAEMVQEASRSAGVLVTARRTFDIAHGWGGKHPMDVPIVVLTHRVPAEWADKPGSPFTFVTDGVASAIAKARQIAGDKAVVVGAPSVVKQCLQAGLMDEIHIDLIPTLLFDGIALFDHLGIGPVDLQIVEVNATGAVIHITFSVIK